jgi:hypothetical protein
MKTAKDKNKTLDDIGFIGTQPKKRFNAEEEKKVADKTRKAMDNFRSNQLNKKKAA